MEIQISMIRIAERIRKDNGDIGTLAKSIKEYGLMNPITLMESGEQYVLIAGFRRLSAVKLLNQETIHAVVLSPMDAEKQLRLEIEENETRKDFTVAERLQYADKLREIEREKGKKRMGEHNTAMKKGAGMDGRPYLVKGTARDAIAKQVGFKSGRQLDRASYVAEHRPDLLEKIDSGEKSIFGAYEEVRAAERESKVQQEKSKPVSPKSIGIINGKLGHTGEAFMRPDGFNFILGELSSARELYMGVINSAASHYTDTMMNEANTHIIKSQLIETLHAAFDAFGMEYEEV